MRALTLNPLSFTRRTFTRLPREAQAPPREAPAATPTPHTYTTRFILIRVRMQYASLNP